METNGHYSDHVLEQFFQRDRFKLEKVNSYFLALFDLPQFPALQILTLGGKRSGKTFTNMRLLWLIHSKYNMRVAFLDMPDRFENYMKHIDDYIPRYTAQYGPLNWFYRVDSAEDTKTKDILYCDEAGKSIKGARARSSASQEFEDILITAGHDDIPCIASAQRPELIIEGYRGITDILLILRMATGWLLESDNIDPTIRKVAPLIKKLEKGQAIAISNNPHFDLTEFGDVGLLTGISAAPFWDPEEVSKMWRGQKRKKLDVDFFARTALKEGVSIKSAMEKDAFPAWLVERFPPPDYRFKRDDFAEIRHRLALLTVRSDNTVSNEDGSILIDIKENTFEKWFLELLGRKGYNPKVVKVIDLTWQGVIQKAIAEDPDVQLSQGYISKLFTKISEGILPRAYERYRREQVGDKRILPDTHQQVDCFRVNIDNAVESVKYSTLKKEAERYYPDKDCIPEWTYCKEHGINTFIIHYHNSMAVNKDQEATVALTQLDTPVTFIGK